MKKWLLFLALILTGCCPDKTSSSIEPTVEPTPVEYRFIEVEKNSSGWYYTSYILKDTYTGDEYLLVKNGESLAITKIQTAYKSK